MTTFSDSPSGSVSFVVPEEAHGWRLDKTLGLLLTHPDPETRALRPDLFQLADLGLRARRRLCDNQLVLVNGKTAIPGLKVRAGQSVVILPDPAAEPCEADADEARLITQDQDLAALYKPADKHTARLAGSLAPSLESLLPTLCTATEEAFKPFLLNRLDEPTSGIVLAARTEEGGRRWRRAERIGHTDKYYLALVEGQPFHEFTVCRRLDTDTRTKTRVRNSDDLDPLRHTDVTPLTTLTLGEIPDLVEAEDTERVITLVGCRIRKGARHQIRAHLAAAGHPLLGDTLYGSTLQLADEVRFFLHHGKVVLPDFEAVCHPVWLPFLPVDARERGEHFLGNTQE